MCCPTACAVAVIGLVEGVSGRGMARRWRTGDAVGYQGRSTVAGGRQAQGIGSLDLSGGVPRPTDAPVGRGQGAPGVPVAPATPTERVAGRCLSESVISHG